MRAGSATRCGRLAAVHDAAGVDDDDLVGDAAHEREVLLDEQDRGRARHLGEHLGDLGDELGGQALGRLVDEQQLVATQQHAGEGDHLLLPAREGAGPLVATADEVGEELGHDRGVHALVRVDEAQVLVDGQSAEDLAVLGHVADAAANDACGAHRLDLAAAQRDPSGPRCETDDRLERRRLADAVAPEQRGDAGGGHVEGDALEDVRAAVVHVQVVDGEDGLRGPAVVHSASPR